MHIFLVEGITCGACVKSITKALLAVDPNAQVNVDLESKKVSIRSTESENALEQAIEDAGFKVKEKRLLA